MPVDIAAAIAAHLVEANLKGVDSHGVIRLAPYLAEIAEGGIVADARPAVTREAPGPCSGRRRRRLRHPRPRARHGDRRRQGRPRRRRGGRRGGLRPRRTHRPLRRAHRRAEPVRAGPGRRRPPALAHGGALWRRAAGGRHQSLCLRPAGRAARSGGRRLRHLGHRPGQTRDKARNRRAAARRLDPRPRGAAEHRRRGLLSGRHAVACGGAQGVRHGADRRVGGRRHAGRPARVQLAGHRARPRRAQPGRRTTWPRPRPFWRG